MLRQEIKKILNLSDAQVERSENVKFGDYSTNVALKLAKKEGKNPMETAEKIKNQSAKWRTNIKNNIFEKIEVAPPGFINFFISKEFLQKEVGQILKDGEDYGKSEIGQGKKIQVEFISANPTGRLTLGNGRGGVYGDVLGNILKKAGAEVVKEYYVNDAGKQTEILMDTLREGTGVYLKSLESFRKSLPGDVIKSADKIHIEGPEGTKKFLKIILDESIKKTVANMGIEFDVWFSEREELRDKGKVDEIIKWLQEKDLAYKKDDALWFRAKKFGDADDRVLIKKDGEPTYFGVDCAYHKNKFEERKFDKVINIWGADHHGDVKRVMGFVEALGYKDKLKIILMQFVRLVKDGKPVSMSKREGVYILVDDVLKEVGPDVFRFFMLMYSPDTHMDFNLDLAKEQSEKNPVYYVQYAYARISSILRKAQNAELKPESAKLLTHEAELSLIKQLIRLSEVIEDTVRDHQVQRLPQFALDLVRSFHKFYEECRVIDEKNPDLTQARLALVEAARIVLKNTLDLMGISAPERM